MTLYKYGVSKMKYILISFLIIFLLLGCNKKANVNNFISDINDYDSVYYFNKRMLDVLSAKGIDIYKFIDSEKFKDKKFIELYSSIVNKHPLIYQNHSFGIEEDWRRFDFVFYENDSIILGMTVLLPKTLKLNFENDSLYFNFLYQQRRFKLGDRTS